MESPRAASPGGGGGGGGRRLTCEACGHSDVYADDEAEDGLFSCRVCSAVSQDTHVATVVFEDDRDGGAVFSFSHHRLAPTSSSAARVSTPKLTAEQIRRSLGGGGGGGGGGGEAPSHPYHAAFEGGDAAPDEPRDFATEPCSDAGRLAAGVRQRYVQGLQVMLQRQLEALVERFRVGPLVCGVAGSVWLRCVATSKVFDEMWAQRVIAEAEEDNQKPVEVKDKYSNEDDGSSRRRIEFIFLRALRKMLPVYSTLAVCFLACHIAREAVLPTDIYEWATAGYLPYIAAFTELDRYLGNPQSDCPLSSRQLFRPVRVIGAWQLEVAAASIAQRIGLRLPSVNFYAIAYRYLKELSVSVEKILPHACHIYEWAMPAELWLSSNAYRLPTRVYVMSILIITLRFLYDIHGQGRWEMSLSDVGSTANAHDPNLCSRQKTQTGEDVVGSNSNGESIPSEKPYGSNSCEFNTKELFCTLEAAYDKMSTAPDYSKDLLSYLKYCKDVVFSGMTISYDENHLVEIFWDLYKDRELQYDDNPKVCGKSELSDPREKRPRDGQANGEVHYSAERQEKQKTTMHVDAAVNKRRRRDGIFVESNCFSASSRNDALERMKSEMEEHGFYYVPPRKQRRSDGYLHYKRKRLGGCLVYAVHADYYILLRAFSKLAQVDVRIMHNGVLKLEKKLAWIEQRIERSLNTLQHLPSKINDELRPVLG